MANRSDGKLANTGAAVKHQSEFFKDPIKVSVGIGGALLIGAGFYIANFINPAFDRQTDALNLWAERQEKSMGELTAKVDSLADEIKDLNGKLIQQSADARIDTNAIVSQVEASRSQIEGITAQLVGLDTTVSRVQVQVESQIVALQTSIDSGITQVEEKTASNEKKMEETLAALPETEKVVTKLDEQGEQLATMDKSVEDTGRGFKLLESLVLMGIEHPLLEQTIYTLVSDNPVLTESDALIRLWESRGDYSPANFVGHLMDNYSVTENDAMLVAYPALTEAKPIRYFIPLQEIEANAEPEIAAAKAADEESAVPLAKPLSIARVCAEMPNRPTIECYKYFLDISTELGDDKISLGSPSDGAVMKLIVEKHEADVPNS